MCTYHHYAENTYLPPSLVPRLSAWVTGAEKREPGTHCTRMRQIHEIQTI